MTDVLAGQIPLAFATTAGATAYVEAGKLNLLAIFGVQRDEQFPDTPTVVDIQGWAKAATTRRLMRSATSAVPSSGAVGTAERAPCHIQNASAAFAHPTWA